jgi:hypothetical protein
MEAKIIEILTGKTEPVKTIDIVRFLNQNENIRNVNPVLYSMLSKKILNKCTKENGKDPSWVLSGAVNQTNNNSVDLETKVRDYLAEKTEPVKTIDIVRNVDQAKSTVNAILYKMSAKKMITKTANENGTDPRWILNKTE